MGNKGKLSPLPYGDMVLAAQEKRENSGLYDSSDADVKLSALVSASAEEIAAIIDSKERITLTDTETVERRGVAYLRSCADGSSLPSMTGLARCLGMSSRALNDFKQKNPNHKTSEFLDMMHDAMSDILADASIKNGSGINTIYSIFLQKARWGMRDNSVIEVKMADNSPLNQDGIDAAAIAKKYGDLPED